MTVTSAIVLSDGRRLAYRIRGAHRDIIDGIGGALLWARADLVLARAVGTDEDSG